MGCLVAACVMVVLLAGCTKKANKVDAADVGMTTEQILHKYHDAPVSESIGPVAKSLKAANVFAGKADAPAGDPNSVQLTVANDKNGQPWLYVYSSQAEFSKATPQGGAFVELSFPDLLTMAETNAQFAGILLNSASEDRYPIPREVFASAKAALL